MMRLAIDAVIELEGKLLLIEYEDAASVAIGGCPAAALSRAKRSMLRCTARSEKRPARWSRWAAFSWSTSMTRSRSTVIMTMS